MKLLVKLSGLILMILGITGIFLPIVPGILLLTIGALIFFSDRLSEIRALLPERIPALAAVIYGLFLPKMLRPFYEKTAAEIPSADGRTLLDIGSGPGTLAIEIAERLPGSKVIGIDLSEKMVEIAERGKTRRSEDGNRKTKDGSRRPELNNLEFRLMDAKALDFADNTFDFIISTGALHHWKEPVKVLNEVHRCLKAGAEAWLYDGYADAEKSDAGRDMSKLAWFFPPYALIRYMLNIHGYTDSEYRTLISGIIGKSAFKKAVFERRGIMMRIVLKKQAIGEV